MTAIILNECPKCHSKVMQPLTRYTRCEGPMWCLQNVSGKHTHIDTTCPFCGYAFQSYEKDGW